MHSRIPDPARICVTGGCQEYCLSTLSIFKVNLQVDLGCYSAAVDCENHRLAKGRCAELIASST